MNNKVLIISYYWTPAGGPGVQRWLKFVKYLPDFNIEPIVYVPENPIYPILDNNIAEPLSNKVTILKNKISEPNALAAKFFKGKSKSLSSGIIPNKRKQTLIEKLMLWVRGNLFIPDSRVLWVKPSVEYLSNYIQENNIQTIITTGPPHSLHLIGLSLKEKFPNVQWISDFRDPWTSIGYHKELKLSNYSKNKHFELERKVLNTSDKIIVTSFTLASDYKKITSKPIEVITNGYDVEKIEKQNLDNKFSMAHIGSFLSGRNPRILWKALKELVKENDDFKSDFQLKLAGVVSQEIMDTIAEFGLQDYVLHLGYLSHLESVKEQRKSQVLLLIEIDSEETKSIIPGKLFEYMVSHRPIIGIGPEDADFARILKETNTGEFSCYDEKEKLKEIILKYYKSFQQGSLQSYPIGLQQYSRKNLTEKLVNFIKN